jgi:hypothetical protein
MPAELSTTNVILAVMAALSVLEALVVCGLALAGFMLYRRAARLMDEMESRHIAPVMMRVNGILDDVKHVSLRIRTETERVDRAINHTVDRVDDTAERMRSSIRVKTARIVGFVRGARTLIETMLQSRAA